MCDAADCPPFLVFEGGDYTFDQWIAHSNRLFDERRYAMREVSRHRWDRSKRTVVMLLQILELLADVHEQGQVIGSLGPSRIVWFSAEHAWKLLDLCEFSAQRRRTLPSAHLGVRYTAPEIVLSESREGAKTVPESPSDMWSFGVMLLEMVLPGAFRDPLPSMESIISCVQGRAWSIQTRVREPTDASPCQDRSLGV